MLVHCSPNLVHFLVEGERSLVNIQRKSLVHRLDSSLNNGGAGRRQRRLFVLKKNPVEKEELWQRKTMTMFLGINN